MQLTGTGMLVGLPVAPRTAVGRCDAAAEWRRPLTAFAIGTLLFETVTGLTIYLLPFSVFNQFAVLAHSVVGLLMVAPVAWYIGSHGWRRWRGNFSHYQLLGYVSAAAILLTLVSGLVVTWQAAFGNRIGRVWDLVHLVGGFAAAGFVVAHLATVLARGVGQEAARAGLRRAWRVSLARSLAWGAGPAALCGAAAWVYRPVAMNDAFPSTYEFEYGPDRPYAPSLARKDMTATEEGLRARLAAAVGPEHAPALMEKLKPDPTKHVGIVTLAAKASGELPLDAGRRREVTAALAEARRAYSSGGAIDPRRLAGSENCGRCHEQIVREWLPSAHRYASMDFVFQKVQENMAAELAPHATRYCAGCHDPIALFSGAKNVGNVTLSVEGAHEGVSCLVCHSMVQTDVRGNADYTIDPGRRYLGEFEGGPVWTWLADFLIRAYPRQHVSSYSRPLYKTAEACGACHKQFVDEEVNGFGWVQGQNQYDSWRKSRWHHEGDPARTLACRDCHMPLVDSSDPAAGDRDDANRSSTDGKHRSHRFLAANQFVPRYHDLPGAEEHCDRTVQWLRGQYEVPEIADRWTPGPVVKIALVAPPTVRPGESVTVQTIVTNNKAGHDFPTGPLDMIEGWVEVTATDADGRVVFASARADERGYLVNPEIVFKAELIDRLGELIGRHELWRLVGARYKRALFPGMSDTTTFTFNCPGTGPAPASKGSMANQSHSFRVPRTVAGDALNVTAIVWYTKFSAPFLDRLFGAEAGLRSEVTDIARAEAVIRIDHDEQAALYTSP